MIATTDDVLNGVRVLWAVAGMPAFVTGGLHDARGIPATVTPPLAVVKVMPGDKMTTTANVYLEKFTVQMWIHSVNGRDNRDAMGRQLAGIDFKQSRWPLNRGHCLHVRPLPAPTDESPFKNQARDIAITPVAWEVLMQQTRL